MLVGISKDSQLNTLTDGVIRNQYQIRSKGGRKIDMILEELNVEPIIPTYYLINNVR